MTSNTVVGDLTVKAILAALPRTRAEVAAKIGRDHSVVSKWIKRLHADKKVYILRYVAGHHGGAPQPVYARRRGIDAPRPATPPPSLRSQRQRDKSKAPPTTFKTRWAPGHPWASIQY